MQRSIYDAADDVQVRDPIPRDPYLDDRDRGENKYKLKFISAFSKGPNESPKFPAGFFKARFTVLEGTGENPYEAGTDVTLFIKPRQFNGHIKDIKKLIGALTNTKPSTVSKANIDEVAADNPDNGGSGEITGVVIGAELVKNDRGFLDIHYKALAQN